MKNTFLLFICILVILFLGALPGFFTMGEIPNWYSTLKKPTFNPPNYLFGPIWTILFTIMGITLYSIFKSSDKQWQKKALLLFTFQFVLNFFWTILFFRFHQMTLALIEIIVLIIAIFFMIQHLYKKNKVFALINIPYLAWVSFASVLNLAFVLIN